MNSWLFFSHCWFFSVMLLGMGMLFSGTAISQPWQQTASGRFPQSSNQSLYQAIDNYLASYAKTLPGNVTYEIGTIDARMALRRCDTPSVEIYRGANPWGRTRVAVNCTAPSHWTLQVPVHIRVQGNYPVAARPLGAGDIINESDIAVKQGEISALPRQTETDVKHIIGKRLVIGLANGQPFRRHFLKTPDLVQRGQTVRIEYTGNGFTATNSGEALSSGGENDTIGVRLSSGTVIKGIIQENGVIKVQ